jgi:hypothetical protein
MIENAITDSTVVNNNPRSYDKGNIPTRSTYTPTNADEFRKVFERMITDRKNLELSAAASGYKAGTLYVKANDALKFLADNDKDPKFATLRSQVSVKRKGNDGILIYFKISINNQLASSAVMVDGSKNWKEELICWLSTAKSGEVFERGHVSIDAVDRTQITNLLATLEGVELDMTSTAIKVMR